MELQNPFVPAQPAEPIEAQLQPVATPASPIMVIGNGGGKTGKIVVISVVALVALVMLYFFVYRPYKKKKEALENSNYDTATTKGQANVLADQMAIAMHGFGTNENAMYEAAKKIGEGKTSFNEVAAAYWSKYKESLSERIKKELNSKEFKKFNELLGAALSGLGYAAMPRKRIYDYFA